MSNVTRLFNNIDNFYKHGFFTALEDGSDLARRAKDIAHEISYRVAAAVLPLVENNVIMDGPVTIIEDRVVTAFTRAFKVSIDAKDHESAVKTLEATKLEVIKELTAELTAEWKSHSDKVCPYIPLLVSITSTGVSFKTRFGLLDMSAAVLDENTPGNPLFESLDG